MAMCIGRWLRTGRTNPFMTAVLFKEGFSTFSPNALRWNLFGALCLERKPVISPPMHQLEKQYEELLCKMEYEKSLMNDHELRHLDDIRRKQKFKTGEFLEADLEASSIQTAQDFEDMTNDMLSQFKAAAHITKADECKDTRSLNRRLDRNLLLVLKMKHNGKWELPACMHRTGETLKQTAERALVQYGGESLHARILGNAPIGVYKFKYNAEIRNKEVVNNADGGKVFFFRAYYVKGAVQLDSNVNASDFSWATREELSDLLKSQMPYLKCIQTILSDETFDYIPSESFSGKYLTNQLHS